MAQGPHIAETLDITLDICPMTFVKTKLALEDLGAGDVLEVLLRGGEPLENVTRSCEDEGHAVLSREPRGDLWRVLIRRGKQKPAGEYRRAIDSR